MISEAGSPGPSPGSQANSGRISSRGAPVDQPPVSGTASAAPAGTTKDNDAFTSAAANTQRGTWPSVINLMAHPATGQNLVGQATALTLLILYQLERSAL